MRKVIDVLDGVDTAETVFAFPTPWKLNFLGSMLASVFLSPGMFEKYLFSLFLKKNSDDFSWSVIMFALHPAVPSYPKVLYFLLQKGHH